MSMVVEINIGMLYISLREIAEKFPNKLAVNDMTYSQLMENSLKREYKPVCYETDVNVLLDVINAAYLNKPLVVLPKEGRDTAIIPDNLPDNFTLVLYSSGSTGAKKPIFLPEKMMMTSLRNVIKLHRITPEDKILTICSMNHTAGINCHTMGGLLSGATVIIDTFSPFTLLQLLEKHEITLGHVLPLMTEAVMKSHDKPNLPKLRLLWTGSDCITKQQVEYWMAPGREFFFGYGMTEAGPPTTYHFLNYGDDISMFDRGLPVGTKALCETRIVDGEMWLRGDIINVEGWFQTGDCMEFKDGWYWYIGRKSAGGKIVPKGKH